MMVIQCTGCGKSCSNGSNISDFIGYRGRGGWYFCGGISFSSMYRWVGGW